MAEAAGARLFVPVHHQTFQFSHEPFDEPIARADAALSAAKAAGLNGEQIAEGSLDLDVAVVDTVAELVADSLLSAIAIWQASPGKVRAVAGKVAQG